jgi:cobalt/nickel transport system permease protein
MACRLDPRTRVLAAVAFALAVSAVTSLTALGVAVGLGGLAVAAGGASAGRLVRSLLAVESVLVLAAGTLPFSVPGHTWLVLAGMPVSVEGTGAAARIFLKANAVTLAMLGLVGGLEAAAVGHALARLRVHARFVQIFLFTVRDIDVLHREYGRLRLAMRARAFRLRTDGHTWRSLGWLIGMLMVRSFERAERILAAMRCRGFDGRFRTLAADTAWGPADGLFAVAGAVALVVLLMLDRR